MNIASLMPGLAAMPTQATPSAAGGGGSVEAPAFEAALLQALSTALLAPKVQPKQTLAAAITAQDEPESAANLHFPATLLGALSPVEDVERAPEAETPAREQLDAVEAETTLTVPVPIPVPVKPASSSEPATARVERSLERLDPVFRTRLEHVIERMRDEFGIEVRVVETHRSQERQNRLYEQGRTEPGPTVTWTRHSNHTQGRAADLRVVGDDQALGYARLAKVAAEEGLRTLGPNDRGHVEMKGTSTPASGATQRTLQVSTTAPQVTASGMARVADVARVAQVAQVARVAQVAPTGSTQAAPVREGSASHSAPTLPAAAAPVAVAAVDSAHAKEPVGREKIRATRATATAPRAELAGAGDRQPSPPPQAVRLGLQGEQAASQSARAHAPIRRTSEEGESPLSVIGADAADAKVQPVIARAEAPAQSAAPAHVEEARGADIAARVARVLALHDAAAETPTTGMTLMLEDVDGATARIRLDVRGNSVGARIDVADAKEATDLGNRIGELRRALERHGLDPAGVSVRETPKLRELTETVRTVATATAHDVVASTGTSRSGDGSHERPSGQPRREQGAGEDRPPRRNHKEERK
jgi:hypothetical protein